MLFKGFSLLFLGVGVFVLMQVISPLVSFKLWEFSARFQNQVLADPTPSEKLASANILGVSIKNVDDTPFFIRELDGLSAPYPEFRISVPKINLKDVTVKVNSNEFEESLAHMPGTALPGERGNIFISGHSSISNVFQSKKNRAFFVNLTNVKKGDEILVEAMGQTYKYTVEGLKIVNPSEVGVINPQDEMGRYISLMTCVPPGFNTKRLVVLAKLKQ